MERLPCRLKYEMFFSLVFYFKEKKMMWQYGISSHPTVHFLTFSTYIGYSLEKLWNRRINKEIEIAMEKIKKMCHVGILAHPTVHHWWNSVIRAYWNCETIMEGQPCTLKCEIFFNLVFYFKEKKNDVIAWKFSSSYCAFLDFFNIESRGAIVDEAQS